MNLQKEINKYYPTYLVKSLCDIIYDDNYYYGNDPSYIKSTDELEDYLIQIEINGITIEEYDILYWMMCSTVQTHHQEMIDAINFFIDENCQPYYGDPAFSSANDYWEYKMG